MRLDMENLGKMIVVENHFFAIFFLGSSNFLSNYEVLEINKRVLNLDVQFWTRHIWVLLHKCVDDLILRSVKVLESLFD
jgi:hypothetical protein